MRCQRLAVAPEVEICEREAETDATAPRRTRSDASLHPNSLPCYGPRVKTMLGFERFHPDPPQKADDANLRALNTELQNSALREEPVRHAVH